MDPSNTTANPAATSSRQRIRGNDERRDPSPQRLRSSAHQVALCAPPPEKKITGEQFFQKTINSDCWLQIKTHLSARDILALRHTCSFLLSGQMPLLCPGQNQALIDVLVEGYYNRNKDVQSLCRQIMTPYFTRIHEHKSAFCSWVEKNLGEQEQILIGKDVLRQGALHRYLSNRAMRIECVATLRGHTDFISCVTLLPDGRFVSGCSNGTQKIWDPGKDAGAQCVATLQGHTRWIRCVLLLPDGRFVSGSDDHTLKIWDPSKEPAAQCVATLRGHTHWVLCVTLLPDGRFVSGSCDKTLKIWDPSKDAAAQCVATLRGHTGGINCILLLPDGRFVSGSSDHNPENLGPKQGPGSTMCRYPAGAH